jgi:hypothetical protein
MLRSNISDAVSPFIEPCIKDLNALVLLRKILKFMSCICTNNTTDFNKLNYLTSSTLVQVLSLLEGSLTRRPPDRKILPQTNSKYNGRKELSYMFLLEY